MIRLARRDRDFWELRSGEESRRRHPDTFLIPSLAERTPLKRGQAAKLVFDIESVDELGNVVVTGERMWVIVSVRCGETYIGILDNQPASLDASDAAYLCFGAEIPFLPEHVVDIGDPPSEYVEWQLGQTPERRWPRE